MHDLRFIHLSYTYSPTRLHRASFKWRSIRWLDRCIAAHAASGRASHQNLFAIIQGGLDHGLRDICLDEMIKRKDSIPGYAVGGLSGGEAKGQPSGSMPIDVRKMLTSVHLDIFWRM